MFKVLIADDQKYIRHGIADHIDWAAMDCEVVGLAANGEEALAIVEATHPNVIITDIMMPLMTGLELIEKVTEKYDDIYIVIISAYDEFNYVQKAIKLGAKDYILKPVDLDYIKTYIQKAQAEYKERQAKIKEHSDLVDKVNETKPVIRRKILRDLIYERISSEDANSLLADYEIVNDARYHVIMIGQVDDYFSGDSGNEHREQYNCFLSTLMDRIKNRQNLTILDKRDGGLVMCVSGENRVELNKFVDEICELLQVNVSCCMEQTMTISVSNKAEGYSELADAYKKSVELMSYKYILGKSQIITEKAVKQLKNVGDYDILKGFNEKELVSSIKFSDEKQMREGLRKLEDKIREMGMNSYIYTNLVVASIYRQALEELEETGGKIEDVYEEPLSVYTSIISQETINGMISELDKALVAISKHIGSLLLGKSVQVEKAKDYIESNYAESDISLDAVAKHVSMSASYFGIVFKQEMGVNFVDFLTGLRIDKAKELLKKGYKSYEVSDMVGYNNPTYFSTVFKRVTGVTPSKFT